MAGLGFWWWRAQNGGAGRPVPAPRSITFDQTEESGATAAPLAGATIALTPEQVRSSGIKVEPVGEQLAIEEGSQVATGVVQSNAYRETPVVTLVGGIVRRVRVELGQQVTRGQAVAVIFSDELAKAQSEYLAARAMLDEHHKHHARTAKLLEIGAASREEFEQATTRLRAAESEVASLRQRLLLFGLAPERVDALRSPSEVSSEVSLPAPVSGTVINRSVNPGEVVEANKELLRIADLSTVWVIGQVYEKDMARVRPGSGASVTTAAYPGRVLRGRVSYIDPKLDPATRTAQVRIELANPGQMLKLGMYVNIAFGAIGGSERTVPVVPVEAAQMIGSQQVVFVATADPHVFAMRPVRLGPESNGRYTVLEGLHVGERVVTEGSFMLRAEWLKSHPGGQ
jgi:RND family efflux transporter MFP subunit